MKHISIHTKTVIFWLLRLAIVVILWQTLWFKFTGHPESVAIFSRLNVEPWGRIATGVAELCAGLLLLWSSTVRWGAWLALGIMVGAILSHLLVLGIDSAGDGGVLFGLAWLVLFLAIGLLVFFRGRHARL